MQQPHTTYLGVWVFPPSQLLTGIPKILNWVPGRAGQNIMFTETQIVEPVESMNVLQKWEGAFRDLQDQIWWPGFSEQLIEDDPARYQKEYEYFMLAYD